ncbi:ZAR1-like protein isoform X1 [Hemicordylus capensis]|uniref:ZAR1-like protein isoform X1 n=1 Tax=Hemicordylus capensis TaxID=884348 RepID=UPI002302E21A|nr:ZAR1-like protein isoform X1 [Hemicordylus capensis]
MERFVYPPYSVYQGYGSTFTPSHNVAPRPPSKQKQPSWKQSKSTPNPYRGVQSAPSSAPSLASPDYLDTYKRAQLKALLSQVSPGLTPRLRKANTKEIGVQVNPRVDAAVQCSLGSRPLQAVRPQSPSGRFSREPPLPAVYSPVLGRRLFTLPEAVVEPKEPQGEAPASKQSLAEEEEEEEAAAEDEELPKSTEEKSAQLQGEAAEGGGGGGVAAGESKTTFQFLEQKYGYFHCNDCKTRWESAYVWCISGTNKVYFKQLCRKCQKSFNPYKVEAIQCQICSKTRCSCPQKKRHIDLKRPHRQELCGRCKGKRLSCDNTYSFKYIV